MNYEVIPLFSTPLSIFRDVLDDEKYRILDALVKNCDYGLLAGAKKHKLRLQNDLSKNLNILSEVPEVKKIFEEIFTKYMYDIKTIINTKFIISSSWAVKLNPGESGGDYHAHANSYFSGVMYFENNVSSVVFKSPFGPSGYTFDEEKHTMYNTSGFVVNPEKNMLLIFPSQIEHRSNINLSNKIRYCLAFNIISSGNYGYGTSSVFS
jgi:hypothetical protein